jgi:hypothetical protein
MLASLLISYILILIPAELLAIQEPTPEVLSTQMVVEYPKITVVYE